MSIGVLRIVAIFALAWAASAAHAQTTYVFAAASLKTALDAIVQAFDSRGRGAITTSYAGTPALARQIERGAPADLFISADTEWMDYLAHKGLVREESRANLLSNRLVLIAPASSTKDLKIGPGFALAAALGDGRLAMADPNTVPAGRYGHAALASLGIWNAVADRVARAENVRLALALVARGEAPFGVVYRSDALIEARVRIVGTFPADSHPEIVYPAAIIRGSRSRVAPAFLQYLRSRAARSIWLRNGFEPKD